MADRVPSPRPDASDRLRVSPRRKRERERVPIKFIEIETEDQRDDENEGETNLLASLIDRREWDQVQVHIETPRGVAEASLQLPSLDYALHLICKSGANLQVNKFGPIKDRSPRSGESSGSSGNGGSSSSESSMSNSGSITSASPSEGNRKLKNHSLPPLELVQAIMNANLSVVRAVGAGGALPLHSAVRHMYPAEILQELIREYPQALDMRDSGLRTPRDFAPIMEDLTTRSFLLRPTSCWMQQIHDEKVLETASDELGILEAEVNVLLQAWQASQESEEDWERQVSCMEDELDTFETMTHFMEFAKRAEEIQEDLEHGVDIIRAKLEGLVGRIDLKYADEEKDRAYLASFNDDVHKVYENINCSMDDMKIELESLKIALQS